MRTTARSTHASRGSRRRMAGRCPMTTHLRPRTPWTLW
ncbi:hypothetical protein RB2654_13905 [Rhodobacterales bacterium HTCC2654]|uniref:Uncharacterized protein n=1 Tax=Maritimibacter alkaliphilus HTCC2654 TaxID=314271 RepID=A3VGI0_9RHOB|nr:hypothetical protein RB2654_13905 [Rhodobacterales bacterium HTCC2654] [Maritimibacter alkaliphilus HTCC2654]